ncbi:MAG: hypothetical protein HW380_2038 [Magnetococcales bacterium]|nr:hypothetical protein [Magnetococcales bacterium]
MSPIGLKVFCECSDEKDHDPIDTFIPQNQRTDRFFDAASLRRSPR